MVELTKGNSSSSRDDESIRARLLNSLGIHKKNPGSSNAALSLPSTAAGGDKHQTLLLPKSSSSASLSSDVTTTTASSFVGASAAATDNNNALVLLSKARGPVRRESLNDSKDEQQRIKKGHRRVPSRKRIVHFGGDVLVQPIASHRAYSKRIRRTIWTSAEELNDHVYRNTAEFMAEGMDWKKVLEDDDMYMDAATGEKIHPYWVEHDESIFEAVKGGGDGSGGGETR